jgi:DNA-binding transcriptional ArsR family regulator
MDAKYESDDAVSGIAAAIGEPARARMLYSLMDGHARTSTELAIVADVSASTASAHLKRLEEEHLITILVQGKHRYHSLNGPEVASVLEGLSVLAGVAYKPFVPSAPRPLCAARTCYDHIAGTLGVMLHDRFNELSWLTKTYDLTAAGSAGFESFGIDIEQARSLRRRFACACLDWSERRPHIGGALGAAILSAALKRRWVSQELDTRALSVTTRGRRELLSIFGLQI